MWLSSIFSFSSIRELRPRMPWGLPAATILFLVVLFGLPALPHRWFYDDGGGRYARMVSVESLVLSQYEQPEIVILGSSRSCFGINPRTLSDALGKSPDACVNASIISGDPALALKLYQRNESVLGQARLVVLVVDEWHLNSGDDGMFEASVNELRRSLYTCRMNLLAELELGPRPTFDVMVDEDRQMWLPPKEDRHVELTAEQYRPVIDSYYRSFRIRRTNLDAVRRLTTLVRDSGGKLVLMQMPNRPEYHAEVIRLQGDAYRQQLAAWSGLAEELDVPFVNLDDPTPCGLTSESFRDGMHLRPSSAKVFASHLAQLIKTRNWLN